MFPENKLKRYLNNMNRNIIVAFVAAIILGIICHAYMMTNKWTNLDDIVQLVDKMDRTSSGRWFLKFPSAIGSDFSIPWLNGFLTIFYSGVMASFVVAMFDVKSKISAILIGGILSTFPTLASVMPFMNTQDSYQFAAMLAGIAAYLFVKKDWGYIGAAVLLTLSLGIYQTYLGYAAGLVLIYILLKLFEEDEKSYKEAIRLIIKLGIACVAALATYIIISRGVFGDKLVNYRGLDKMGSLPMDKLPSIMFSPYEKLFKFIIGKEFNYHFPFMPYLFVACFAAVVYMLYHMSKMTNLTDKKKWLLLGLIIIFPLAVNSIYVMSWESGVMLRMAYAYTVIFILPLLLIDFIWKKNGLDEMDTEEQEIISNKSKRMMKVAVPKALYYSVILITITSALSVYNNIYVSNKVYFKVGMTNRNSDAYANRIATRIEMADGYTNKTEVVFIGEPDSRTSFTKNFHQKDMDSFIIADHLTRLYSFKYYPARFLGLNNHIKQFKEYEDEIKPFKEEIDKMGIYPAQDSIKTINGRIYVKFKDINKK